jgi:hypothetical protein
MATYRLVIKGNAALLSATSDMSSSLDRVAYVLATADGSWRSVGGISRDTGLDKATVISTLAANRHVFYRADGKIGGSEFYGGSEPRKPLHFTG